MTDQLLTCANCGNPFVYSVYEQIRDSKKISGLRSQISDKTHKKCTMYPVPCTIPQLCPICTSIKSSEAKHPPKPKK